MASEYGRRCERCGTTWYLPKSLAKAVSPNALQTSGEYMISLATMGIGGNKLGALKAEQARVIASRRCPNCGSGENLEFKAGKATLASVAQPLATPSSAEVSGTGASPRVPLGKRIDKDLRSCPMCAEPIRVEARKCRHCGSDVEPLAVDEDVRDDPSVVYRWGHAFVELARENRLRPNASLVMKMNTSFFAKTLLSEDVWFFTDPSAQWSDYPYVLVLDSEIVYLAKEPRGWTGGDRATGWGLVDVVRALAPTLQLRSVLDASEELGSQGGQLESWGTLFLWVANPAEQEGLGL